jgi:type I restriction enzyme S subunit
MEELCELVTDGTHDSPKLQKEGVPFVKGKNISGGTVDFSTCDFITLGDHEEACRRVKPQRGDILFSNIGSVGDTAVVKDDREFSIKNVALFRPDRRKVDQGYFYYLVLSPEFRSNVMNVRSGSAQPFISLANLRSFEVSYVENPGVQRRIAGILSAYDELMENSQRRIRLLEAMARALYREWFVHFRFPGHEKLPRVASSLGDIPHGWEVKTIADVCESVSYGYTASASRDEVGPKFLRITDIVPATIDWAGVPFCEIPEEKAPKYLLKHGDIVVARTGATTGYAKRLNKLHPDTVFASYLVRARAMDGVSNRMLGIVMESDEYKQYIQTNIGGAAQPQANAVVLTSMRLAVPPSSVGEKFDRLVAPMIDEAELLAVKIQNLRRTRDLLLPRLLSGQVNLKEN